MASKPSLSNGKAVSLDGAGMLQYYSWKPTMTPFVASNVACFWGWVHAGHSH